MNKNVKIVLSVFCFLLVFVSRIEAKVSLPKFFSDNMVLQRDMPLKIWGYAAKGETVIVSFNNQEKTVRADKSGKWVVTLDAMKYGGPFQMKILGKDNTIELKNILIGDVWICSGQSNMEWQLKETIDSEIEIKQSANPNIRLLTVEKAIKYKEADDIENGSWQECNPETSQYFSAVGYYFGKELESELNIPIGLINTSFGGTDIQTWTSWETMLKTDDYKKYVGKTIEQSVGYNSKNVEKYMDAMKNEIGLVQEWYKDTQTEGWKKMYVPKIWDGDLADDDGVIWFRKEVELPGSAEGKPGTFYLTPVDDADKTYINGTFIGETWSWDSPRIYKVPEGILRAGKNTIVVRVEDVQSMGGIYGDPDELYLEVDGHNYFLAGEWDYKPSVLTSQYGVKTIGANSFAALLYNGMVKPLVGYGIKGVIWYQGENNDHEAYKYRTLFPNLINDWRSQWGYDFPFLWVQLANYKQINNQPTDSNWAELREAQNMALRLPRTGQAVITDIGEADDIHPRNKKDVSHRLFLNALKTAYEKDIFSMGPVYDSMKKEGNKIILKFTNTGTGLSTSDKDKYGYVKGFTIAGEDEKFVWAKAYIEGNNIVVFSEKIDNPVSVRYGWADNPHDNNLINSSGLLASPFRTDNWKGITEK